ncbi:hypothetical protein [Paenibacillus macerans]|uniref:hypothetical protein n=1 Tax=Paenibacillus macerans TaxID=44252 RepID=UPI003D2DBB01
MDEFIRKCSELVADTMQELINKQKKYTDKKYFIEFYHKDNRFHQLILRRPENRLPGIRLKR